VPITNAGKQKAPRLAYDRNDHPSSPSPFTPLRDLIWYSVWHRIQGGAEGESEQAGREAGKRKERKCILHTAAPLARSFFFSNHVDYTPLGPLT